MTPTAPTWADIEAFLAADKWRKIPSNERGGRREKHTFYDKLLPSGEVLQTHVSHSSGKAPSPLQFQKILYYQIQVKKEEFWECIRTGVPVDRPVELDEPTAVEHPSWVVAVLVGQLHVSADELAAMSLEEAEARVHEHWSST